MYIFVENSSSIIIASPTPMITSPITSPTRLLPTASPIPTYAYKPTFTPYPTSTSFVLSPLDRPTSTQQPSQSNPITNPSSGNSSSGCSAELAYAEAMHQYYLDFIDYIHSPMINYYQQLLDEALRNRDALGVTQAQQGLDNEKAQVNAEKATENKRYKAERAKILANCQ